MQRGFTLFEVMVSIALIGVVLTGMQMALTSSLVAQEEINQEMAQVEIGPEILDRIEADLMAIHLTNIKDNDIFLGREDNERGAAADRLDLICRKRSSGTREKIGESTAREEDEKLLAHSDVTEIGYRLRGNPEESDFLELWRREDFYVDELPFEGGRYELLFNRVISFDLVFYSEIGEEPEEVEEWSVKDRAGLPAAIKVILSIEPLQGIPLIELPGARRRKQHTYERLVVFPRDSELALQVVPEIPDMELAMSEQDMGGLGGGGDGTDGGGDDPVTGGPGSGGGGLSGGPGDGLGGGPGDGRSNFGGASRGGGNMGDGGLSGGRGGRGGGGGRGGDGGGELPSEDSISDFLKKWLGGG